MSGRWRLWIAAAIALAGLAAFLFLPFEELRAGLVSRAERLGTRGAWLIMALFVPASLLCLPGTPITFACAYVYGFTTTLPAAIVMSNLGAAAAVLNSRFLLSAAVARWLARRPRLSAVHRAIGAKSFRLVFLLRLTPAIPFNGLNYALGVTPIRFGPYALATLLGMLPGTTLNCYTFATLGELGKSLDDEVSPGVWGYVFLGVRVVVAVIVTVWISRIARRALGEAWREPATR